MKPVPAALPTMPNPCQGVPQNAWCPSTTSAVHGVLSGGRNKRAGHADLLTYVLGSKASIGRRQAIAI
jgi:hypothetical protein